VHLRLGLHGIIGGYLVNPRLKLVHWVDPSEIPASADVAKLGQALAYLDQVYELMANFAAYTGLRWSELAALTAAQIHSATRTVDVDRKVIERHWDSVLPSATLFGPTPLGPRGHLRSAETALPVYPLRLEHLVGAERVPHLPVGLPRQARPGHLGWPGHLTSARATTLVPAVPDDSGDIGE
jgi:hypothetical protein